MGDRYGRQRVETGAPRTLHATTWVDRWTWEDGPNQETEG